MQVRAQQLAAEAAARDRRAIELRERMEALKAQKQELVSQLKQARHDCNCVATIGTVVLLSATHEAS